MHFDFSDLFYNDCSFDSKQQEQFLFVSATVCAAVWSAIARVINRAIAAATVRPAIAATTPDAMYMYGLLTPGYWAIRFKALNNYKVNDG